MKTAFAKNPFTIFYIVFGYIIVFSVWWAFLLYQKNETAFKERVEINAIYFHSDNPSVTYINSPEYHQLEEKYSRQKTMILLEGTVFIVLLIIGLLVVRRILVKEMQVTELQKNFLLSVSHELKSPLASIKLNLQTLNQRQVEKTISDKLMNNSILDIARLESLIDNILFASKMEATSSFMSKELINLSEVTEMLVKKLQVNPKQINISGQVEPNVYLETDPTTFISAINNLLENAIKYSPEKTAISVVLQHTGNAISISVADQGYGIAEEERERIFDKFYRVGSENTRKSKGTGLGLYIVKRFVDEHQGSITIQHNQPQGSVFTLLIPVEGD